MISSLIRSSKPFLATAAIITLIAAWLHLIPVLAPLFSFQAFQDLADPRLQSLLGRTLWLSFCAASLSALLGIPAAILSHRIRLPFASLAVLLLPLPLLLPPLLLAQAWHGLTGMDGPWAAVFSLGLCGVPFVALFASQALERQSASAQESALLIGGPFLALRTWLRCVLPAAFFGATITFLFTATDFAVPDYFAAVGDKFSVYAAEVFNGWRSEDLLSGANTAAPLVLLAAVAFYIALVIRDRSRHEESGLGKGSPPIDSGRHSVFLSLLLWAILALVLLLPIGRILWETGAAGPEANGDWFSRSADAFQNAIERGRFDLLRSLRTGILAGAFTLLLAPFWAHFLLHRKPGRRTRLLQVALALPLLSPSVGTGLGAILIWNRPLTADFYDSWLLPPLILAGRFLPLAVFLLVERMERIPRSQDDAAQLAGTPYPQRIFCYLLGPQRATWLLSGALVAVFAIRELDLAVLLPAANPSAAVRYYNALHFARDGFVAAFGLLIALILFLPVVLHYLHQNLKGIKDS